ncbi:hypothetical protein KFL_001050170 [Klebsormidium nitens]|uniref:STI1/HOP DP domain-containing protein n=1 Tax=Klebsormidium nitens TaxID=105231 RepID=A0A1Y1HVQ9_KLENI|nr:hypothetical protein KFL_001050170 [Klebsormidium nitens]|eukprot:GAQ82253.1 hypothetical protein KFL_001050170 [Klebsormidium nitens]
MRKCSRVVLCSAGDSPGFNNSIIEQEAFELSKLFATLGPLQAKYFDFDLEGKKIFCAQMEAFVEKLQVFTTRYRLMDDPTAKEYIRRLDAMMLEAGTNSNNAMENMRQVIARMQEDISNQEKLGANYQRPHFGPASIFRPEFSELCQRDPEVQAAMADPLIMKAVQDVVANPANVTRYADNPRISKFFQKVIDPRWLGQEGS